MVKMNEDSERSKSLDKSIESAGWQQIGFTRPLAGLLWNIVLILGGTVFALTFSVWLMPNVIYPFPTAMGWESMTKSLFEFYFAIADVGLGTAIQRFIGEDNVKSPPKDGSISTILYLFSDVYRFTSDLHSYIVGFRGGHSRRTCVRCLVFSPLFHDSMAWDARCVSWGSSGISAI